MLTASSEESHLSLYPNPLPDAATKLWLNTTDHTLSDGRNAKPCGTGGAEGTGFWDERLHQPPLADFLKVTGFNQVPLGPSPED